MIYFHTMCALCRLLFKLCSALFSVLWAIFVAFGGFSVFLWAPNWDWGIKGSFFWIRSFSVLYLGNILHWVYWDSSIIDEITELLKVFCNLKAVGQIDRKEASRIDSECLFSVYMHSVSWAQILVSGQGVILEISRPPIVKVLDVRRKKKFRPTLTGEILPRDF